MLALVICVSLTLIQIIFYVSLIEVFSETKKWFSKYKMLVIAIATINGIVLAWELNSVFYIKIVTTIVLYFAIAIIVIQANRVVACTLAMVFLNLLVCLEYLLGVIVLNIDLLVPGKMQGNADILQVKIVVIEEIILLVATVICSKNKGKLKEIKTLLVTKDWIGIFIITFVSALILILAAKESGLYYMDFYGSLIGIAITFMNVAIIHLFIQSTKRQKHLLESEAILNRVKNETTLYKSLSDNMDKQRKRIHEFDNQLFAIKSMAEQGNLKKIQEYINNLQECMPSMQQEIDTRHVIINAILNAKNSEMQSKKILFVTKYNDLSEITIRDVDLVVLLSNLLNNAVEACEKASKKIIKMKFAVEDNQIILSIKNTIAEMPIENGGTYLKERNALNQKFSLEDSMSGLAYIILILLRLKNLIPIIKLTLATQLSLMMMLSIF